LGETWHILCSSKGKQNGTTREMDLNARCILASCQAYIPNLKAEGKNVVYVKHQRYLPKQKENHDSRLAFYQDLDKAISNGGEGGPEKRTDQVPNGKNGLG
jgi:hypothetical protein